MFATAVRLDAEHNFLITEEFLASISALRTGGILKLREVADGKKRP